MQKATVYCLTIHCQTAIFLSLGCLKDALEMEFDEHSPNTDERFEVWTKKMTEKEIEDLPEFDGF